MWNWKSWLYRKDLEVKVFESMASLDVKDRRV